ncbi:MAG: cysteine desulfurase family protein [Alphaproteobacteria bacterium]
MNAPIYADYNAGAPLLEAVKQRLTGLFEAAQPLSNPSSPHQAGQQSRALIEQARSSLAAAFELRPDRVIFTSSGSEANNHALMLGRDCPRLITKNAHDSLRFCLKEPAVTAIEVGRDGKIKRDLLQKQLEQLDHPAWVYCLWAHNETGVIEDIEAVAELVAAHHCQLHIDAVQAIGRIPLDHIIALGKAGKLTSLNLSAHKLGGLAGAGALIIYKPEFLKPLLKGGGQERGQRAGTENLIGIIALHHAFNHALAHQPQESARLSALQAAFETAISAQNPDIEIVGAAAPRLPNTSLVLTPNHPAQQQLIALDLLGVMVSAGAACSSGKLGANDGLIAQGYSPELAECAIRFSFGSGTDQNSLDHIIAAYQSMI